MLGAMDRQRDMALSADQRLHLLVSGIRDYAIYLLDPDGYVSSWNAGAERFKGYTADEIMGRHFSQFFTEADRAAGLPETALATALREGKFEAEGWRVRKDGSRFFASVVVDAIYDEQGGFVGYAKITRDITERKMAEERLRESEQALQRANAALFQSQKMQAIGQLTGGIAHDFNNLLAVLSSGLDVLAMSPESSGDPQLMDSMRRAVSRGSALTQQLLAFARKQPLKPENCAVDVLIGDFEAVLRRAVPSSIEFDIEQSPGIGTVAVDAQRFEAALLNLVVNARDAMPGGGVLLVRADRVTLRQGEVGALPAGDYARVSVIDNGVGMLPDVQQRAFEPFFTTKDVGRGTGLGLSQVHGFINQSGGDVTLSSEPGQGTSISIYLPIVEAPASEARRESGGETVLIVEDEPELLTLASSLFRSIGYDVLGANNGADAVRILERGEGVDILFTDVVMPHMSGVELARWVGERFPSLKIVLTSGYPVPALAEEHGALDDYAFVQKPYRLAELAKALRKA
jgi:PAS domain S-box-containing protein